MGGAMSARWPAGTVWSPRQTPTHAPLAGSRWGHGTRWPRAHHGGEGDPRARVLYADARPPTPPPTLEIGTKVPDHRRLRRRKQNFLDVAKGKKWCFHPLCLYSICSEFSREINIGQKWVFFQSARNKYPTCERSFLEMATTLVGGTLY